MSDFCENLKKARLKAGYSQKDVAFAVGVAKSTYSLYESGKREPNVDTIKKLSAFLHTSGDVLLGIDDTEPTIAAHHDGEWSQSEKNELEQFKEYIKSKRDK